MERQTRVLETPIEVRSEGKTLRISGYAAVYNRETVIAGLFRERIAPGAFASALDGTDDVRALFNHDPSLLLGRTKSGTLTLTDDKVGLRYSIVLDPDDPDSQRVHAKIKRGDVDGSSFGFSVASDDDMEWDDAPTRKGLLPLVTLRKVTTYDVSPVTFPAYPQTSVSARSRGEALRADIEAFQKRMAAMSVSELLRLQVEIELARAWR
jgi:HK97 family phage prohead protease